MKIIKIFLIIFIIGIILNLNNYKNISIIRCNYYGQRVERASDLLIAKSNSILDSTLELAKFNELEYRYLGNDVNNYVYFNCSNSSNFSSCELWRIVGVFYVSDEFNNYNYRIKLLRSDSLINSKDYYLSDDYWYTINSKYQSMIGSTIIGNENIYKIGFTDDDYNKSLYNGSSWLDNSIYPVVYLKYDIVVEDGDGSIQSPYVLRVMYDSDYSDEFDLDQNEYDNKEIIDVDDTGFSFSEIILYCCLVIISIGLIIFIVNYIKFKNKN